MANIPRNFAPSRLQGCVWGYNVQVSPKQREAREAEEAADRRGQYRKATLIERDGPEANMVALRLELAAGCPKIAANKIMDLCGVYYPDRVGRA